MACASVTTTTVRPLGKSSRRRRALLERDVTYRAGLITAHGSGPYRLRLPSPQVNPLDNLFPNPELARLGSRALYWGLVATRARRWPAPRAPGAPAVPFAFGRSGPPTGGTARPEPSRGRRPRRTASGKGEVHRLARAHHACALGPRAKPG
jgi:hypothetical protein